MAEDVERRVVSRDAAASIYGVVLATDGSLDGEGTEQRRDALRRQRLADGRVPGSDAWHSFSGRGRHAYGDALVADLDRGEIRCAHCDDVLGSPGQNLAPAMREVARPLSSGGAVRGQDYDQGRFALRQLCCAGCAHLLDVQVALEGAPRPRLQFDFVNPA